MIKVSPEVIGKRVRCLRAHPYGDMRYRQVLGTIVDVSPVTAQIKFDEPGYMEHGLTWWYMTQDLEGYNGD